MATSRADYLRSLAIDEAPADDAREGYGVWEGLKGLKHLAKTKVLRELPEIAATIGTGAIGQAAAGYQGLAHGAKTLLTGGGKDKALDDAVKAIKESQERVTFQPRAEGAKEGLEAIGGAIEPVARMAKENLADPVGAVSPLMGAMLVAAPDAVNPVKGTGAIKAGASGARTAAKAAKVAGEGRVAAEAAAAPVEAVARSRGALTEALPDDPDIVASMLNNPKYKDAGAVPAADIDAATNERAYLRSEQPVLPKPAREMTDADWQAWGEQHGVNMTVTPSQSLGVSDIATRRELKLPGGMEGKFSIPDLFQIKSENFDPAVLGQERHTELMKKFLRTYERPDGTSAVDKFNALNFSLLSPNAPLAPNEFLAQRFRVRNPEELSQLADTPAAALRADERGTGSASRGGMGVKGTADLGNMQKLAQLLRDKPEMFSPGEGETLRDVARRVMNQVQGLGPKTASLGVPWFDLAKGNTSAVDLHIIKANYPRLMSDPELGVDFTRALGGLVDMPDATPAALQARAASDPKFKSLLDEKAISIIGGNVQSNKYRTKGGDVNPAIHPSLAPEKLAFEPQQAQDFGPYYNKVVDYIDEGRGPNPEIELFPEQWRKWDVIRGRVEPHEMAHPDYLKLPRMSWEELNAAKQAQQRAGYFSDKHAQGAPHKNPGKVSWGELFYGKADPKLLGGVAAATGGGLALARERAKALRAEAEDEEGKQ